MPESIDKLFKKIAIDDDVRFKHNLTELISLFNSRKDNIVAFVRKNLTKGIHYQEQRPSMNDRRGGHNKIDMFLTEEACELVKETYKLRNRYITNGDKVKQVRVIMTLENQTIGFIENCFNGTFEVTREKVFGAYRVDLFIHGPNVVVECDELGHRDRCPIQEKTREAYLKQCGFRVVRFNPNIDGFDLSNVINEIVLLCMKS